MRTPTSPTSIDEPARLREQRGGSSSLERALLSAGSSYRSSQQGRLKVLAGLGLAGSTLLGGTAAASVSAAAKLTWTKLLLGVSLVGATAVPVGYYALHRTAATSPAPAHRAIVSAPELPETAPTQDVPVPQAAIAAAQAATLRQELSAIDHARLSLASGETRRALDELEAYDQRFPAGRLQIEAEVMRIDALAKLGRKDAARQHAEAFLRRHPNSVLAQRVRAHVAD
jgi:hypothetical protein